MLALLLSACLKLDANLEVSADDTVSGTVVFAVQKSLLDLAGGSFEDLVGDEAPFPERAQGVSVKDYEDDRFRGREFTFDHVPLAQFQNDSDDLIITRDGDVFHVSGELDLSSGATGATGIPGFDPTQFLQGAELRIRLTFPGEVTDANGRVDGNSVTWEPEFGERLELRATAGAVGGNGSGLTMLLIVGAAALVLSLVVGVVVVRRRGRQAAAAGPS